MNLLPARVRDDGVVALGEGASLEAGAAPASIAARRGHAVTFGIRPEDLSLRPDGLEGRLPATLDVREPLGNEVLLHWSTPAGAAVSRVTGEPGPAVGERALLGFRADRVRWFDPESGNALA